jgi:hypothetical protein
MDICHDERLAENYYKNVEELMDGNQNEPGERLEIQNSGGRTNESPNSNYPFGWMNDNEMGHYCTVCNLNNNIIIIT